MVEGTHEAIVSKEVFDAVQEKLELNSRKRSKTHNNNYPLKGLVKCGGMRSESTACKPDAIRTLSAQGNLMRQIKIV